jgi:hypothetical protein
MPDMTESSAYAAARQRVFIVRPWHDSQASLYPHVMDGVEYVDAVIKTIRKSFDDGSFDVRVDTDVFVPGVTIRENLERELTNADIVFAILDGLRPNVVYELGFAYGQRRDVGDTCNEPSPRIVCLADRDATVLVRNYYQNPMQAPTTRGDNVTILNPPLNMATAFSDNADLLLLTYSRLDLDGTLGASLRRLLDDMRAQESKAGMISEATKGELPDAPTSSAVTPETGLKVTDAPCALGTPTSTTRRSAEDLWLLYKAGKYDQIVNSVVAPTDDPERKVLALSLMKLGLIYEAMRIWREMASGEHAESAGPLFHLGICYYAIGRFETAAYYLEQAHRLEDGSDRTRNWLSRAKARLAQRSSGSSSSAPAI